MKEKYEVEENQLKVIITSQTEEVYSLDTLLGEKSRLETDIQYYQSKVADLDAKIAKCRELGILDAAEKAAKDEEEAAKVTAEGIADEVGEKNE